MASSVWYTFDQFLPYCQFALLAILHDVNKFLMDVVLKKSLLNLCYAMSLSKKLQVLNVEMNLIQLVKFALLCHIFTVSFLRMQFSPMFKLV